MFTHNAIPPRSLYYYILFKQGVTTMLYHYIGMILVDAAPEYKELVFEKVLPNHLLTANREYYSNPILNSEKNDKIESYKQVDNLKCVFEFPLTVITRGLPDNYEEGWPNQKILDVEQKLQFEFKKLK